MGNFEKLSVLVIVVIIVMILVVAIYEWTGSPEDGAPKGETAVEKSLDATPPPLPGPSFIDPPQTPGMADLSGKKPVAADKLGGKALVDPSQPGKKDESWWVADPKKELIPEKPLVETPPGAPGDKAGGEATEPKVEPADKGAAKEIAETTHVVASGDTLGGISLKYYGSSRHYPRIEEANPGLVAHSLRVGQSIKIPALKIEAKKTLASVGGTRSDKAQADEAQESSGERPVPGKEYKVRASDTWPRISKEAYKTSERWPEIFMKNMKLTPSPSDLRPGLVIMIPR